MTQIPSLVDRTNARTTLFFSQAVAADTQYLPLAAMSTLEFGKGVVEVEAQDCFATFRLRTTVNGINRDEYVRLGPAGSRWRVDLEQFSAIEYLVDSLAANAVDPATGALTGNDATPIVYARWLPSQPAIDLSAVLYADGTDAPSPPAATATALAYAPGYARGAQVTMTTVSYGTIQVVDPAGNVVSEQAFAPVVNLVCNPWDCIVVNNVGASDQPLAIRWLPVIQGDGSAPPQYDASALHYSFTAASGSTCKQLFVGGPGLVYVSGNFVRTVGTAATTASLIIMRTNVNAVDTSKFAYSAGVVPTTGAPFYVGGSAEREVPVYTDDGYITAALHNLNATGDTWQMQINARRVLGARDITVV